MIGAAEMDLYTTTLLLSKIYPIEIGIHIAFNSNAGLMKQWCEWNVGTVLLLDVSPEMATWTGTDNLPKGWHYEKVRHNDTACKIPLYENISTGHCYAHKQLPTECFEMRLLESHLSQLESGQSIWATINCLPAVHLLEATIKHIDKCCVLLVRVLLKQHDTSFFGARLQDVEEYLTPRGFRLLQMFNAGSELMGDALFVRDCKSMIHAADRSDTTKQEKYLDNLKAENDNLTLQKNTLENRIYELELRQDLMTKQLLVAEEHLNILKKIVTRSGTNTGG